MKLRGFTVAGELIGKIAKQSGQIAESAEFRHAYFDNERNCFVCVFSDESFSPVAEGARIPIDVPQTDILDGYSQTSWVYFDPHGNQITADEYIAGITRHSKDAPS